MKNNPTWCVIDSDTGKPIRWHVTAKFLRQWAASMNIGEGRERYYIDAVPAKP